MNDRPNSRPRTSSNGSRRPPERRPAARGPARRPAPKAKAAAHNDLAKWIPVGAAGALLVAVIGAGVVSGGGSKATDASSTTSIASALPTSPPATVDQIGTAATTAPIQKVTLDRTIADGMAGDDVERIQRRLIELGFDPGPPDGSYGSLTKQSVWAFEKLVMGTSRSEATGRVTPEMWSLMQDPISIAPRRPDDQRPPDSGDHVEIYLPEQVMAIFHDDLPVLVTHISSGQLNPDGTPFEYTDEVKTETDSDGNLLPEPIIRPIKGLAYTPPGVFQAGREVVGRRDGPLGSMYDPVYVNQGIAIHGAENVPLEPASHGCIRVSRYLGPIVQELIDKGDFVYIWDGEKEPEQQTEQERQMIWDWLDTSRTTTTSSTTTTSTTVAPSTTLPPSTTAAATTTSTQVTTTTTVPVETTTTVVPNDA